MNPATSTVIDLTELVYDLDIPKKEWVPSLLEVGLPLFDHGHGALGMKYMRPPKGGMPIPCKFYQASGPPDLPERMLMGSTLADEETLRDFNCSGVVTTLSEEAHRIAGGLKAFEPYLADGKDLLAITAVDPNGFGISLSIPLPEATQLSGKDRTTWRLIGAHLVSGFRLRQSLEEAHDALVGPTRLANNAEAVLDPKESEITDAVEEAANRNVGQFIREAARLIDRARGRLCREDPEEALEICKALVEGRWSLVDWFDSDGRRFVLAHPNPPDLQDPRGLTEREHQVATYAALGETNKLNSYRLGISQPKVSTTLRSAMHKLGVHTRPQLAKKAASVCYHPVKGMSGELLFRIREHVRDRFKDWKRLFDLVGRSRDRVDRKLEVCHAQVVDQHRVANYVDVAIQTQRSNRQIEALPQRGFGVHPFDTATGG
jgi:DNA-binding CsgD family transcriptional regulator